MTVSRYWQATRAGWAARIGAWLRPAGRGLAGAAPDPTVGGASIPPLPVGGGDWIAHRAADGGWLLRGTEQRGWTTLTPRGFQEFRVRVAAAGGCMTTVEPIAGSRDADAQVRRRTVGHWLDGDTRDRPAILRQQGGWVEYYYYRLGNPLSYERMGLATRATAHPAALAGLPRAA
jgi:hypothetical protein